MTFGQFKSNTEQVEAYHGDFEKWWADACLDLVGEFLKENNLHWNDGQMKRYEEGIWEEQLYGAWMDHAIATGDMPKFMTATEVIEAGRLERLKELRRKNYGPWTYVAKNLTLVHKSGYEIDMEDWTTSAQVLDWIFQIQSKPWADAQTIVGLIDAINDKINPQANLCSCGGEKGPIDVCQTIKYELARTRIL